MGRPLSEIVDKNIVNILSHISTAFFNCGDALNNAINSTSASKVSAGGVAFEGLRESMINQLQADLQNQRGPVAKRLLEEDRISVSHARFLERAHNSNIVVRVSEQFPILKHLLPQRFECRKDFLFQLFRQYFAFHYCDDETNTIYLSTPLDCQTDYKDKVILEAQDCQFEGIKNHGTPYLYKLTFLDNQPSGCVVRYIVTINVISLRSPHSVNMYADVLHDELEDATYKGTPDMVNPELLTTRLKFLMEEVGWNSKEHLEKLNYSAQDLERDISDLFKKLPLPEEVDRVTEHSVGYYGGNSGNEFYKCYWDKHQFSEGESLRAQFWTLDIYLMGDTDRLRVEGVGEKIQSISCKGLGWDNTTAHRSDDSYDLKFTVNSTIDKQVSFVLDYRVRRKIIEVLRNRHLELVTKYTSAQK